MVKIKINKECNYYGLLGVPHIFDDKELKSNYRQLSKKHHPDIGGDEKLFQQIVEAYKVLSNTDNRKAYDKESKYGANYDCMTELYDFEFSNQNVSSTNVSSKKEDYKKKEMLHIVIEISEFIPSISYERNIICSNCEGTGNN